MSLLCAVTYVQLFRDPKDLDVVRCEAVAVCKTGSSGSYARNCCLMFKTLAACILTRDVERSLRRALRAVTSNRRSSYLNTATRSKCYTLRDSDQETE